MTIDIDVTDVQRWGGLLASEVDEVVSRLTPAVADQQDEVFARSLADAPQRTGALRGTIRRTGRGLTRRVRAGTARIYYPQFVERGTKYMGAQPFILTQADEPTQAEFEGRVQRAVDQGPIYR